MPATYWRAAADVEDGFRLETSAADNAERREARRRIRLLEQEDENYVGAAAYLWLAEHGMPVTRTRRILARGSGEIRSGTPWIWQHVLDSAAEKTQVSALYDTNWTDLIGLLKRVS